MKEKRKSAVSIIGGADGPTSIFIAGRTGKRSLKARVRNIIYKYKRAVAEKKIAAGAHTLEELARYAMDRYGFMESDTTGRNYIEQRKSLKEGLILKYKPEVLGDMKDIPKPDTSDEDGVREYLRNVRARSELIAAMPDDIIPMDYHLYELKNEVKNEVKYESGYESGIDGGNIEIGIDYIWRIMGISYSGDRKARKRFEKISRDLYVFYGVSEEDIQNKTERYSALVTALSS